LHLEIAMTRIISTLTATVLLLALIGAPPAQAQLARTFVSSSGSDLNNCDRLTPCRTFQHAHDQTLANGETTVLDPGGYGAVTINRTISIINDGVGEAGTLVSGGVNGITINGAMTDVVNLRGLTVKGIGFGGGNGIVFNSGKSLSVENCAIRNLTGALPLGNGLIFAPNGGLSILSVTNTFAADNAASGILVQPVGIGGFVNALITRVQAHNNQDGIAIAGLAASGGALSATITDSVADGNSNTGFSNASIGGATITNVMLIRSVAANNLLGVTSVNANVTVRVGRTMITGNNTGWSATGSAVLNSFGDNFIDGNAFGNGAPPGIVKK
jgi:hypothetical protein